MIAAWLFWLAPLWAGDAATVAKGADLDLLASVRDLARRIERFRDRTFVRPPIAVRAPAALRQTAAEIAASETLSDDRLEARARAWADLGFADGVTPRRLFGLAARDLDGVALDPTQERLLVDPARLTAGDFLREDPGDEPPALLLATGIRPDEPLTAHMLVHLLQRQRAAGDPPTTTDAWLADAAWREGEANVVAVTFVYDALGMAQDAVDGSVHPGDLLGGALLPGATAALPAALRSMLDFVYLEGFARAADALRDGGWPALERGIATRRSARDLLHPGRPAPVPPPPPPPAPEGWILADRDVLGEQGIVALVSAATGKDNLGLIAGDGWAGGAVWRHENPLDRGQGRTVWWTAWGDVSERKQFVYAMRRVLEARGARPAGAEAPAGPEGSEPTVFELAGRRIELEIEETRVTFTSR